MTSSILSPFDILKPSQILSRYTEWIYFILVLIFFISIAGITLRKHFERPYLRPLILSVGLMLTVGVFMVKDRLIIVFEGWGILGTILLVAVAGTIPYGLCRGFGMQPGRAFYLTYVLFYILSWAKFPQLYYGLGDRNLGLVNLALLILSIYALYKVLGTGRSPETMSARLAESNPFKREIEHDIEEQKREKKMLKSEGRKMTNLELHTIDDIASELGQIQKIVERNPRGLSETERERIAGILRELSGKESLFRKASGSLRTTFQRLGIREAKQLDELKERMLKAPDKERLILKREIVREQQKLGVERAVLDFQTRLDAYLYSFNRFLARAVDSLKAPGRPSEALYYISKAGTLLRDLDAMLKDMKALEDKIIQLTDSEKRLLKKEKKSG